MSEVSQPLKKGPLDGYRVIELGQLLAGPFTGCMLGYFGAEVIKIEPPGSGDPIRGWREVQEGCLSSGLQSDPVDHFDQDEAS